MLTTVLDTGINSSNQNRKRSQWEHKQNITNSPKEKSYELKKQYEKNNKNNNKKSNMGTENDEGKEVCYFNRQVKEMSVMP